MGSTASRSRLKRRFSGMGCSGVVEAVSVVTGSLSLPAAADVVSVLSDSLGFRVLIPPDLSMSSSATPSACGIYMIEPRVMECLEQ